MMQGGQNSPRMALPQMAQNRPNMMQNPQQAVNQNIQGIQSPIGGQTLIGQQPQQNQNAVPPPPPYPEPPPPYPGQSITGQTQVSKVNTAERLTNLFNYSLCEFIMIFPLKFKKQSKFWQ